jgi:hypothetical protein
MGIAIAYVFVGYICVLAIVALVVSRLSRRRTRAFVSLIAIGLVLPWVDHFPGKIYFRSLCKLDSGLTVSETIHDGFFDATKRQDSLYIDAKDGMTVCNENCQYALRRYFLSEKAPFLSRPGTYVELEDAPRAVNSKPNVGRYWIAQSGDQNCIASISSDEVEMYGFPARSCVAGRQIARVEAAFTYNETPFPCLNSATPSLCLTGHTGAGMGVTRYEHVLRKGNDAVAKVVAFEWRGGLLTGMFTRAYYCPFQEHDAYGVWTTKFHERVFGISSR